MGCYHDEDRRILKHKTNLDDNTPSRCKAYCDKRYHDEGQGYKYFGVESGGECFCGNRNGVGKGETPDDCNEDCPGDSTKRCGDDWRINIYEIPENPAKYQVPGATYVGCYHDDSDNRILPNKTTSIHENNPLKCAGYCRDWKYFGVQSGDECWCGNDLLGESESSAQIGKGEKPDDCNEACPGNSKRRCGDSWRMNIYELSRSSDKYQVAAQISGCSDEEGRKINTEKQCKEACRTLGLAFSAGSWGHSPGCFFVNDNKKMPLEQ